MSARSHQVKRFRRRFATPPLHDLNRHLTALGDIQVLDRLI
jgi:hypothetical protein